MTQTPYDRLPTPTWGTGTPAPGASASTELLDPTTRKFAGRKREVTVRIDYCSGTLDDGEDAWRRVLDALGAKFPRTSDQEGFNAHYQWSRKLVDEVSGRPIVTINRGLKSNPDDHRVHLEASGASGGLVYAALRSTSTAWLPSRIDVALDVTGDLDWFKRKRTTFDGKLPRGREATRIGPRSGVGDPGLTWMVGKPGNEVLVRWYRKGPQSGNPILSDVNRLEFQFRPQDHLMKRALAGCNDPVDIIAMAGPQWVRDLAADLIGDQRVVARVVATPVPPPQSDDRKWKEFLKQHGPMLYRRAWLLNPDDPQSGLIVMWRDFVAVAAYSAARKSGKAGRNPVWDDPRETAFSAKSPDGFTEPARLLRGPAQRAPEPLPYQMGAGPEPVVLERSSVVTNTGDSQPMNGSGAVSNRGDKWLFMDGWVNPAKVDPVRVLSMMGLIQPERTGDGVDRGNRRIRRARAAG